MRNLWFSNIKIRGPTLHNVFWLPNNVAPNRDENRWEVKIKEGEDGDVEVGGCLNSAFRF